MSTVTIPEPGVSDRPKVDYLALFQPGMAIVISTCPGHPDRPRNGTCTEVNGNNISGYAISDTGITGFGCLYHVDDPEWETHPDWANEEDLACFDLAEPEKARIALAQKQVAQDELLADLTAKVAGLTQQVTTLKAGATRKANAGK